MSQKEIQLNNLMKSWIWQKHDMVNSTILSVYPDTDEYQSFLVIEPHWDEEDRRDLNRVFEKASFDAESTSKGFVIHFPDLIDYDLTRYFKVGDTWHWSGDCRARSLSVVLQKVADIIKGR